MEAWTQESAELIDYYCRYHVVEALAPDAEAARLKRLVEVLRRLVPRGKRAQLAAWVERWEGYADLLETRLEMSALVAPDLAFEHLHVQDAYRLIEANPRIARAEVRKKLGLSEPNMTRVLNILKEHGLVKIQKLGKEKLLQVAEASNLEPEKTLSSAVM